MSTNLSLRSLLDSDKLSGPNFESWFRKVRIVLEHERILYVITDPAPEQPAPNVLGNQVPVWKHGGGILKFFIRLIILIYYMLDHI